MADYGEIERTLVHDLQLTRRPVAVSFLDAPPGGVLRLEGSQPSGCTFWSLAAEGRVFYTAPEDHYNCPIGSYTHNMPLPPEREHEFSDMLALMNDIGYLRMADVPGVPRLAKTPGATVYAPLGLTPTAPDVVVVTGTPGGLMLLHEAALRSGMPSTALLGRPTCMAIPAAMATGFASTLGCVGNRVYTGLNEAEFYCVIRADGLATLAKEMATVAAANAVLTQYYRERRASITGTG